MDKAEQLSGFLYSLYNHTQTNKNEKMSNFLYISGERSEIVDAIPCQQLS